MRQAYYIANQSDQTLPVDIANIALADIESLVSSQIAYWLVDMRDWQKGWTTLCFIRGHLSPLIYLKPVIFLLESTDMPTEVKAASDGHINLTALSEHVIEDWASKVEPINLWIDRLSSHRELSLDSNLSFKVLRLVGSRNIELKPIATVRRTSGYVYPIIEPLFGKRDTGAMDTLSFLKHQALLTDVFVTRAHFCGHCGSAFLNFKETCPHCGTDDLDMAELVHHFKCAYTAELAEFQQGDRLICPKCELQLRHIGVDYDKPSTICRCNQCNHRFQDTVVMTDCYSCGRSAEPTNQEVRRISAYTISAIGQNAAYHGLDALFTNLLDSEFHLYSANAFRDFFRVEVARISRYKISSSSLAMINFKELDNLYVSLGRKARQVFGELSVIFKAIFRESDVITARNESIFFVIMTETNYDNAKRAMARLDDSVKSLFENNLNIALEVNIMIKEINTELDLETTLESFLTYSLKA